MRRYDYIIAGAGLAGLSLAYYLNQTPLRNKSILIIDQATKDTNDRTWCFWEKYNTPTPFEPIIRRSWNKVAFHGTDFSDILDLGAYRYKWLSGLDFYEFVKTDLSKNTQITFAQERIERIKDTPTGGFIITGHNQYLADYVFDSITPLKLDLPNHHNLLQHFKGWEIRTDKPCFDPECPIMMDYRIEQPTLGVRFMYILPLTTTQAMVEFTVFSDKLLPNTEYDFELNQYLKELLKIKDFTIEHEEFGVIPMSDVTINQTIGNHIVRIGTAGGYVKPSTGYAFQRTQRFTKKLVEQLSKSPDSLRAKPTFKDKFKALLDSTLLNVLLYKRASGKDVFTALYKNNPTPLLFAFLDEDTTIQEDIKIMNTVPLWPFVKGMVGAMWKRMV